MLGNTPQHLHFVEHRTTDLDVLGAAAEYAQLVELELANGNYFRRAFGVYQTPSMRLACGEFEIHFYGPLTRDPSFRERPYKYGSHAKENKAER